MLIHKNLYSEYQSILYVDSLIPITYKDILTRHMNLTIAGIHCLLVLIKVKDVGTCIEKSCPNHSALLPKPLHSVERKYLCEASSTSKSSTLYVQNFQYSLYGTSSPKSGDSPMEMDIYCNNLFSCSRPITLETFLEGNISSIKF